MSGSGSEEGRFAVEAAIVAPAVLLFVLMVIAAGRLPTAGAAVDAAARMAARSASLARTADGAGQAALATAQDALQQQGVRCASSSVDTDLSGFSKAVGQDGEVTVTVHCAVPLGDLALLGRWLPGEQEMRGRFTSVLDRYRGG